MSQQASPLRIAVQDRQRLFRDGLALVLHAEPDFTVVATAATAGDLVGVAAEHDFDLVILELDAPDWDACGLVAALRTANPRLAVVGISADPPAAAAAADPATRTGAAPSPAIPMRAYQAGVRRVFPRSAGIRTLLDTVRSAPTDIPLPVSRRLARLEERRPLLTGREVEVLGAIGTGATTRGVAASMGISPKTVENHKQRIFAKLGVQNQAHAVSVALRSGLLSPVEAAASPFRRSHLAYGAAR